MLRAITSCVLASLLLSTSPFFFHPARSTRIAVIDFGTSPTSLLAASEIRKAFSAETQNQSAVSKFEIIDRDEARAAALGSGYPGSLNLELQQARDLGAAMGTDF